MLLALSLAATQALGQTDGTPDTAFDFDGSRRIPFDLSGSTLFDLPAAVAVQPDGSLVVAGTVVDRMDGPGIGTLDTPPADALLRAMAPWRSSRRGAAARRSV